MAEFIKYLLTIVALLFLLLVFLMSVV